MKNKSTNTIKNGKWYSIWSIKNNKTVGVLEQNRAHSFMCCLQLIQVYNGRVEQLEVEWQSLLQKTFANPFLENS